MTQIDKFAFTNSSKPTREPRGLACPAVLLGVIVFALLLGWQLTERNRGRPVSGPAPDFSLTLFDGSEFKLSDQRGQVVLINFWASWCPPCRDEAPDLQALHIDYQADGFTLLGVNMLESSPQKALDFIAEFGITYRNGEDLGQTVTNLYRVEGPPESFLIDRGGKVREFYIGSVNYDLVSSAIKALLAEPR
ncbi:MAG: TlpA disulfide reductase family protein [Chloroflexi bacterium]|nr:TlpA disulfide reductase family protein [Chloroflexota bacterium]